MSKLTTITDKIVARADAELLARIKEASKPLDSLLRDGSSYNVTGPREYNDDSTTFTALWWRAMQALESAAFEKHKEANRQKAVDAFEARVANLESRIDEFRQEFAEGSS